MSKDNLTIFQKLGRTLSGVANNISPTANSYSIHSIPSNDSVIDTAKTKEEYDKKILQLRQDKLLSGQWFKAQVDINNYNLAGLNDVKLMYRDTDLMDCWPEIGAALDIYAEETTFGGEDGNVINISSNSNRIKGILDDLFINRLSINTMLPMICRCMCKYGNEFMLLNTRLNDGILGWRQLPVYEIERYENGMRYPYMTANNNLNSTKEQVVDETKFVWVSQSQSLAYRNWQVAHFRLLYDSQMLPYGVSILNKARRHFRILSMMEDSMLIYRLDRSMERRIFKINVGAIDDQDVPQYVQEIANNFKRTPIIDPQTGQLDLRKNIMANTDDFFIPFRPGEEGSSIENLSAGQNLTAMDDIKYMQGKILTALRTPRAFLNFEESAGDGKNLSLMDVRFTRTVNKIQQALLMELNKIAIIHLYLLGFTDELTNFKITMNNPSSQAEMLEIENMAKRITTAKDAVSDPGGGMPLFSMTWAWKHIFKMSDKEIQQNLEEIRLETALAAELQKTTQIIKKTGLFDPVDNIYGEPGAEYSEGQPNESEDGGMGGTPGGGGGGMPVGGGDLDFGDESGEETDMGMEGEMDMGTAADEDGANETNANDQGNNSSTDTNSTNASPNLGEMLTRVAKKRIDEKKKKIGQDVVGRNMYYSSLLTDRLLEKINTKKKVKVENTPMFDKTFFLNEELDKISKRLEEIKQNSTEDETIYK